MPELAPTVFVIDDDADMRESLGYLMRTVKIPTRTYASANAFLADYQSDQPGCLVCDVRMPELSGLDLFERLAALNCRLPVIFMTAFADVPMAIRALKSGAVEFIEKPFNAQLMLERIQRALAEDRQLRTHAAAWDEFDRRMHELTAKERESLQMILEGAPNKAMAAKQHITERAVEMRRASIMRKLQAHSLAELIRLVTRHQILGESHKLPRSE